MKCILVRWEARTSTLVRQIAKSVDFVRIWPDIWRHSLMTWHDIDLKFSQYVSNWSTGEYSKFRFTRVICKKNHGGGPFHPPSSGGLTLLLVREAESPPPLCFSGLYQKPFGLAPWNLKTFRYHVLSMLCQNFDFLPCAEAAPGSFLWRYFSLNFGFSDIFLRSAHCWGFQ